MLRASYIGISYHRVLQGEENSHVTTDIIIVLSIIGAALGVLLYFILRKPKPGPNNPIPSISSLSPSSISAASSATGLAFVLTVIGSNFIEDSVVRWNGSDRPTRFINSKELQADIPLNDIERAGAVQVSVFSPETGGGTSDNATFIIRPQ